MLPLGYYVGFTAARFSGVDTCGCVLADAAGSGDNKLNVQGDVLVQIAGSS